MTQKLKETDPLCLYVGEALSAEAVRWAQARDQHRLSVECGCRAIYPTELAIEAVRATLAAHVLVPAALCGISSWGAILLFMATVYLEGLDVGLALALAAGLVVLAVVGLHQAGVGLWRAARYVYALHRWGRDYEQALLREDWVTVPVPTRPLRPDFWTGEVAR